MAKPLIVHVVWTLGRAGAERMVFDVCRSLKDLYSIEVIALGGGGEMMKDFHEAGIPVIVAPSTKTGLSRRAVVQWLKSRWQDHRPAMVHTHLGADIWAGMAARSLHIPHLITAHSHERDLPWLMKLLRWRAYRAANHVIAVSDSVRRMLFHQYGVSPERCSVIRIGIDLAHFESRLTHHVGDTPRLISVGRLIEDKGHQTLLEALAKLKRPWTLEIVGDGPERVLLQRRAELLGIMPRIHFTGSIPDVAEHLKRADVFLLASKHEGQAVAVLEAAAVKVPMIISHLPVFLETFSESDALFAKPGDSEEWANKITEILNQYGSAIERAERARKVIEQHFSLDQMKEEYKNLYHSLLGVQ